MLVAQCYRPLYAQLPAKLNVSHMKFMPVYEMIFLGSPYSENIILAILPGDPLQDCLPVS